MAKELSLFDQISFLIDAIFTFLSEKDKKCLLAEPPVVSLDCELVIFQYVELNSSNKLNCHSPTQPQPELELDLIMGRNPPPPPHAGTFKELSGNLGS